MNKNKDAALTAIMLLINAAGAKFEDEALAADILETLIVNSKEQNYPEIGIIAKERRRQVEDLGYDYTHDALYADGQLAKAGAAYALPHHIRQMVFHNINKTVLKYLWPWDLRYWKPSPKDRIKELGKAGALIAAQIKYELNKQK